MKGTDSRRSNVFFIEREDVLLYEGNEGTGVVEEEMVGDGVSCSRESAWFVLGDTGVESSMGSTSVASVDTIWSEFSTNLSTIIVLEELTSTS